MQETKKKTKNKLILLTKSINNKTTEKYFFKYAFPCAQVKIRRGTLTVEEYNNLRKLFLENNPPDKETLEKIFPPAFKRIKKLADKMNKEVWDPEVIKEYWTKEHNRLIDNKDGMYAEASETLKDLCKIHEAEVIEKKANKLLVKYDDKKRAVFNFLIPDINIRDKVTIHYAHAIEKVN